MKIKGKVTGMYEDDQRGDLILVIKLPEDEFDNEAELRLNVPNKNRKFFHVGDTLSINVEIV